MAERVSEPTTGVVRAELIPALWRDSAALWLGISGEAPGPCSANIWHRVTDVSETSEGIAVSFDDGPDKILPPTNRWTSGSRQTLAASAASRAGCLVDHRPGA